MLVSMLVSFFTRRGQAHAECRYLFYYFSDLKNPRWMSEHTRRGSSGRGQCRDSDIFGFINKRKRSTWRPHIYGTRTTLSRLQNRLTEFYLKYLARVSTDSIVYFCGIDNFTEYQFVLSIGRKGPHFIYIRRPGTTHTPEESTPRRSLRSSTSLTS